ncbi:E3 ubiquitin-protein ligase HERC2-like [Choristoneura fumiferana]|uniref:E3 ubiquitin-protein ligase HERC2-like n=1 Tax=Choristoneura fumiferana TaxID=7141 RepID=UPI003D15C995
MADLSLENASRSTSAATPSTETAVTVPYVAQIRRLIVLCKRHLVAVIREYYFSGRTNGIKLDKKTAAVTGNGAVSSLNKTFDVDTHDEHEDHDPSSESALGLARVGARAALRLALSLVRRAWRCGEDADVCSALLKDALEAVRALPDAALFAGAAADSAQQVPRSQKIWAEVVDSAGEFLHQVVTNEAGCNAPLNDWRTSLCVWVELCARRAELPALLKAADVLVTLPPRQQLLSDNSVPAEECKAPLGPFLRRMAKVPAPSPMVITEPITEVNPTVSYLK